MTRNVVWLRRQGRRASPTRGMTRWRSTQAETTASARKIPAVGGASVDNLAWVHSSSLRPRMRSRRSMKPRQRP
eukprot:7888631-Pyramimonas_sp.AAC.1